MAKSRIKFKTHVLSSSDINQIYAYFDRRRKQRFEQPKPEFYLDGTTPYGVVRFWR